MTDNEKRAHDLAIACLPKIMNECDWKYYLWDENDTAELNPDVLDTYVDLYHAFLADIKSVF